DVTATYRARILESDSNRILQLMAAHYPIEQVMVEIAEMVVRQWPGTSCVVYQRTGDLLYRFAQAGAFDDVGDPVLQHLHISVDTPNFAMPALNGRRESRFATPNAPGYWSLPIQSGDHALLGVITVFGPWKAEPDLEQSSVLETASRLAAVALEQRQLRIDLQHRVFYDALTELPNRALLETRIEVAASFARKHGHRVGLLCFDLDRFKEVNETLGHQVGDALLRAVADRISVQLPSELLLARLGGDEFALLIPDMHSVREILVASEAILQALSEPFYLGQHTLCASASIGMAVFPDDCADSCLLHSHADSAMYFAKSKGRNSVQRYHPNAVSWVRGRIETETGLRRALTGNQLALHFQPVANENRELIGVEALVRWRHPERGLLFPGAFLSVAEDSGLIVPIGRWILEEACRQAGAWRKTRPLNVSVNVSFLQLQEPGLTNVVADLLAKYSLTPELLTLELTESTLMRNADEAARQLAGLRALGVRVAVDDFGTGYSSLSYLQSLPLDSLKIDRSFVAHLGHANDKADAIVRAIIGLAKTFDLRVIAEGVETLEQFQALRDLGADHFQGYYFGQAMPADRITDCLSKSTPVSLPLS
ncbi:MAG TPA: EAL domain-containing protein, partial [Bryobacteraceae bacterium]|nr:EAL domain-containing protein [Bryobacteraceae bacterium]